MLVARSYKRPPSSVEGNDSKKKSKPSRPIRIVALTQLDGSVVLALITDESGTPAFFKDLVVALEAGEGEELQYLGKYSKRDSDGRVLRYYTNGSSPKRLPVQGILFAAESHREMLEKGRLLGNLFCDKVKPFRGGEFEVDVVASQETEDPENFQKLNEVIGDYDAATVVSQIFYDHLVEHGFQNLEQELSKYFNDSAMHDVEKVQRIIRYKFQESFQETVANPQN